MKKTFKHFVCAASLILFAALIFSSCKKDPITPESKYHAVCVWFGDANGFNEFIIQLTDKNVTMDDNGNITGGSGDLINLRLLTNEKTNDLLPASGEYQVKEYIVEGSKIYYPESPAVCAGLAGDGGNYGSFVTAIADGVQGDMSDIESGNLTVTVEGTKMTLKGDFTVDGKPYTFEYSGNVDQIIDNGPFAVEKQTTEVGKAVNMKGNQAVIEYIEKENYREYVLMIGSNDYAFVSILIGAQNSQDVKGEYPIVGEANYNVAIASSGLVSNYITPTYLSNAGEQISMVYFITEGSIKIADKSITVNAKSYYGTDINVTYEGEYSVVPSEQQAPAKTVASPKIQSINKIF